MRWGIKKRFADGQVFIPYPHFLGYDKGPDGRPQVNPEQARLVRRIYRMFLSGYTMHRIAVTLTDEGVPVPGPRGKKWYTNTIKSILTNEKYRGDALLQKTYIADFLTKKQVKNKGEVAQYYVTGSHEAIIDPETWDLVQYELEARKGKRSPYPFTMKLRCAVCSAWYGSKVWHSTDKYRSVIWQCNNKYRVEHPKPMPHLPTKQIEDTFQATLTTYIQQRSAITARIQAALDQVMDTSELEAEQKELGITIEGLQAMMVKEIDANAHTLQNQDDYRARFAALETQFEQATSRFEQIGAEITDKQGRHAAMRHYLQTVTDINADQVAEFSPRIWHVLIDHATIEADGAISFTFKDGTTIDG